MNKQEFIDTIAKYVIKYAPQYGICVYSPIIAQACLESGYGTSNKVFCNGEWRHNYFGLKWRDKRCAISNDYFEEWTSEQRPDGSRYNKVDKFCKFKNIEEGVIGYFQWTNTSKYANLKGEKDPLTYLQKIKAVGYASSINYVENVYNVIKANNLTKYDKEEEEVKTSGGNSSLVDYKRITHNKTVMDNKVNRKITIHHMAGNLSVETCANVFCGTRKASSNYGIGTDGRVGLYVDEKDRAWTSSSSANDSQAVTIEVANDTIGGDWHVSDKAFNKLIDLCVDICKRNGIKKLIWTGDKNGTLTCHYMFAATACPGPYLKSKMAEIANLVNARLSGTTTTPEVKKYYRVRKSWEDAKSQTGAYAILENAKAQCKEGYSVYDWNGKEVYSKKTEYYTVKKGDTLSKIGAKLGINWQDIAKLNNIKAPYVIYPNQKLRIK